MPNQLSLRSLKDTLKRIPAIGAILLKIWGKYRAWARNPTRLIQKRLRNQSSVFVVQVGSNDGMTQDPIRELMLHNKSWRGLFVEPVPYLFRRLKGNYGSDPRFQFANVAVGATVGAATFYYIAEEAREHLPSMPIWYDQLGSFQKDHIKKHFECSDIDAFIKTIEIDCVPLDRLLQDYFVSNIDVLHVDTEGHDWEILRQLPLDRYTPMAIMFEHAHLSAQSKGEARARLQIHYEITDLGRDYLCLRTAMAPQH